MEKEIKHRLKRSRRRERAERMQAQRDHGDSAEDETLSGVKPHRPPIRRKKAKEPIFEEDIIDGFAILAFRSYEELEMAVKMATTKNSKYNMLGEEKMRNQGNLRIINRHSPAPGHDAGTSDDSGRASEVRPSGLPHGHRESSHDRLSDASSRCSSERGYICDSEGEDDKGSDAGSLFAATPTSTPRKNEMTDSGGTRSALLTNGLSSPPRTGVRSSVSSSAPVPPLQPNGLTESSRNSVGITLPNFQSSHLGKSLEGENASTKPRLENLALNSNDKSRAEMNCQALDKRLESNTHIESKRLDGNTHQHMIGNFDKRLDGHFNHLDKGRIEGMHHEKNSLDKSRLDSVRLEKTRVDVLPVHVLENAPVPSHLDKRTLDNAPGQVDKCLENSVHAPVSLDKRKDSHSSVVMDKGRMERDVSLAHAPVSSPTHGTAIPNSGPPASHVHSPALPNNPPHQQAAHPGGNTLPHKPIHSSHMYQNSIKTHLHNPGLPSHNGTTLQFPPKRPLILHNPILSPSIRPLNTPTTSSVPPTTTSASPVISNSNSMSTTGSIPNSGIPNLSTTLSLSNTGESSNDSPGIFQHSTLHSVNHLSNQSRSSNDSVLPPCPGSSPQPGGVSLRTSSDSNQNITQANTPSSAQHPTLVPNQSTSHTTSHVLGTSPSAISTASLTPATSTTSNVAVSLPSHLELPVTSAVNSHSALSLHANTPSNGSLINHTGVQGSGNSAIHSGYSLSLPGAPYTGYPPLYGPYTSNLQHSPYIPPRIEPPISNMGSPISKQQPSLSVNISSSSCTAPVVTTSTTTSHRDIITTPAVSRSQSPRGHSPTRERDSYSSNVSSLSRGSTTPVNGPPSASPFSSAPSSSLNNPSPYVKNPVWVSTPGPGPTRPSLHPSNFPPPMFAPPLPPPAAPSGPAPFSAESLFQTNQADLLRRELDNRFLASQERTLGVVPAFLRTEMHHHQHQHTHVHQHQAPALYPPPLFKDIPKLGGVDSPFYRGNLGLASYPGFSPGLLGPGLPSTPFAPPSHLPTFTPKQVGDASKPRIVKTGKWNAMHVRVAWEIYHHQQKQTAEGKSSLGGSSSKDTLLRPSGHLFPSTGTSHDLARYPAGFLPPPPHIGSTVTPFGRYPPMGSFGPPPASFPGITGFPSREISSLTPLPTVHDPWRLRAPSAFPVGPSPWSLKPEPAAVDRREFEEREREREREKERIRREREERERDRERREREEKRKIELERERREKERRELERRELERFNKVRDRSPIRNGDIKEEPRPVKEEDIVILGRTGPGGPYPPHSYGIGRHPSLRPPPLTPHFAPSAWPPPPGADPYAYRLDPLLRYNPLVPYRQEEEEQRAKLYGVGGFLPPHAPHHQSSSPVLMKKEESQSR